MKEELQKIADDMRATAEYLENMIDNYSEDQLYRHFQPRLRWARQRFSGAKVHLGLTRFERLDVVSSFLDE